MAAYIEPDDGSERVIELIPQVVDVSMIPGPVPKGRREDLQTWNFLELVGSKGLLEHPVEVFVGEDPPDRKLQFSGHQAVGLELTEMTVADFRHELAVVRRVGRAVRDIVLANPHDFTHLRGRAVSLAWQGPGLPERSYVPTPLVDLLREDLGYMGEDMQLGPGDVPPAAFGTRGVYGTQDGFFVSAQLAGNQSQFTISAATGSSIRRSEVVALLTERLRDKDKHGNDALLISMHLPDPFGYGCPFDVFLYRELVEACPFDLPELEHLDAVVVHLFGSPFAFELYRRQGVDMPWAAGLPGIDPIQVG